MAFAVARAALTRRMGSWSPCRTRTGLCSSRSFGPCHGAPACLLCALVSLGPLSASRSIHSRARFSSNG